MEESCTGCIDERKQEVFHSCKACKEAPFRVNYMTNDKRPTAKVYCAECEHALKLRVIGSAGMAGNRYYCERTEVIKDSPIRCYIERLTCAEMNARNSCPHFKLKPKKSWWAFWRK